MIKGAKNLVSNSQYGPGAIAFEFAQVGKVRRHPVATFMLETGRGRMQRRLPQCCLGRLRLRSCLMASEALVFANNNAAILMWAATLFAGPKGAAVPGDTGQGPDCGQDGRCHIVRNQMFPHVL